MDIEFTTDPVKGEVSQALALYKITLINASYRNFWHRLCCKLGDKMALKHEQQLIAQEAICRQVVNQSPAHRVMLTHLIDQQSDVSRERDLFIKLLAP